MGISFAEPERLTLIFDGENRQEWQNTSYIIDQLKLRSSDVVADIGAGTGYFTHQFAHILSQGKVYAIDCEPNMITFMRERFRQTDLNNIGFVLSKPGDPTIPCGCTVVFLANAYRFISDRKAFLMKIMQQTDTNTRYYIVDFKGENARVSPKLATEEVESAGFKIINYDDTGCPDHYILSFSR